MSRISSVAAGKREFVWWFWGTVTQNGKQIVCDKMEVTIMKEILSKLVDGNNLTKEEAMHAQELILTGQATPAQIACFLTALRRRLEALD